MKTQIEPTAENFTKVALSMFKKPPYKFSQGANGDRRTVKITERQCNLLLVLAKKSKGLLRTNPGSTYGHTYQVGSLSFRIFWYNCEPRLFIVDMEITEQEYKEYLRLTGLQEAK